jgi:hypothetical protein
MEVFRLATIGRFERAVEPEGGISHIGREHRLEMGFERTGFRERARILEMLARRHRESEGHLTKPARRGGLGGGGGGGR